MRRWKVLLCGYYGMENLGDELLASASISLLQEFGVDKEQIAMLSGNVLQSSQLHGVAAFDRWNKSEIVNALRNSRSLLFGGGGIFQDSSSFRSPWYYWGLIRLARLVGCKVWAVGQSIGPLSSRVNAWLARNAFSACEAIGVRDEHSAKFLNGRCVKSDDLVLSLAAVPCSQDSRRLLVNFRPTSSGLEYRAAESLAASGMASNFKIIGVAMDNSDASLMEKMNGDGVLSFDEISLATPKNYSEPFEADAAWGMRLHFCALCLLRSIPCAAVPYDPKVSDFARRWGCSVWRDGDSRCKIFPRPWAHENELRSVREKIKDDFFDCARKVQIL